MAKNFLQYSGLTYEDLMRQINARMQADPRFDNFRESSIAQAIIEIFAGATDVLLYNTDRRGEESFMHSARLRSSVILNSRQLGYVVTRPIPASANIKLVLEGDFTDSMGNALFQSGDKIQIPYHSVFSYDGNPYLLKKTFTYTVDVTTSLKMKNEGSAFSLTLTEDDDGNSIQVVQAEIKEKVFNGGTNPQINQIFQAYRISDPEFSNIYGVEDYTPQTTKVWVGNVKSDATIYDIDRRSLVNWESLESLDTGESADLCVIRTAIDEGVDLLFGDDLYASMGPKTSDENVYVQYLATRGSKANRVGVVNSELTFAGQIFNRGGTSVTNKITFQFNGNIIGGADMESIESIRNNAPGIYYSLDRVVTKTDYINYLKSLTSPINVQNAIAWGEQEECFARGVECIKSLFNVVFFTVVGELYETSESPHYAKTENRGMEEVVLDLNFNENEFARHSYFNIFTKQEVVDQLKEYETSAFYYEIFNHSLYGNDVTCASPEYFTSQYGTSAILQFRYTSDNASYDPDAVRWGSIVMDFSDISSYSSSGASLSAIADKMEHTLSAVKDLRGAAQEQNANYLNHAFSATEVVYDDENGYIIKHGTGDPCFIDNLSGTLADDLGLTNKSAVRVASNKSGEIAGGIIDILQGLSDRSQVTVRNVYISPIIQNFELQGSVYVDPLYDKESLRVDINDEIYQWLNTNADFNVEIYRSKVMEIIESHAGVERADIEFVPQTLGTNHYVSGANETINRYTEYETIYDTINTRLNQFLTSAVTQDDAQRDFDYQGVDLQNYAYSWRNSITERYFYTNFVKAVYDDLVALVPLFANSDDFLTVMNDIHKDLLFIIRHNMLDTYGNIAAETRNGRHFKGGYSFGNELVKVDIVLGYEYKS